LASPSRSSELTPSPAAINFITSLAPDERPRLNTARARSQPLKRCRA
jgi:hypothetical protein